MMHEQAFRFGQAHHLVGIVGHTGTSSQAVGVILLNAGLVYHVGPFRMHVELARQLNTAGYATLRFDLSTLGDSGAGETAQSAASQLQGDVGDAMALLAEQSGCTRFVLVGLCSGASHAHLVASRDPRVAGAVFLDGHAFRTTGFYLRHYLPRMANPVRVIRFLFRRRASDAPGGEADFQAPRPPREQVVAELETMLGRDLKLSFIFSGGASGYFNHVRQFGECFGRRIAQHPNVSVHLFRDSDHTYILNEDRQRLLGLIQHWLQQHFPTA